MAEKNPFGPDEDKTAPSRRNPMLEDRPTRPAIVVVDASPPSTATPSEHSQRSEDRADAPKRRAPAMQERPTDDAVGPSTPRPRLSVDAVPRVVMDAARIRELPLGPRDAFLLSYVDGASDLRTLVDVSGMTRLEVSMVLEKLIDLGAVELG